MEYDNLSQMLMKIYGPILILMSPIGLAMVVYLGMKAQGTPEELSIYHWTLGLSTCLGGVLVGIYLCRKEYGWFKR